MMNLMLHNITIYLVLLDFLSVVFELRKAGISFATVADDVYKCFVPAAAERLKE